MQKKHGCPDLSLEQPWKVIKMIEKNENDKHSKKNIYDGINLTERGADIIVISLSALLVLFLVLALVSGA